MFTVEWVAQRDIDQCAEIAWARKDNLILPLSGSLFSDYMDVRTGVRSHTYLMKEQHIEVEGRVESVLPGTMFRVELPNKHLVLATICGKMRKRWVRLTVGDRVKMEMSPYDLNKARITWRLR